MNTDTADAYPTPTFILSHPLTNLGSMLFIAFTAIDAYETRVDIWTTLVDPPERTVDPAKSSTLVAHDKARDMWSTFVRQGAHRDRAAEATLNP